MKNTELRIGNYFQWTSIAAMGRGVDRICYGQEIEDYMDFKEGIPLTPEWLERFGFYKVGEDDWRISEFRIRFTEFDQPAFNLWTNGDSEFCESIGQDIKYVHQLQNLYFALTGEELELKQ